MIDAETLVPLLVVGLTITMIMGLVGWVVGRRHAAWARSVLLTQVLVSAFFVLIVVTPIANEQALTPDSPRLLGLALFLGLLGLLKLLGRFEEPTG